MEQSVSDWSQVRSLLPELSDYLGYMKNKILDFIVNANLVALFFGFFIVIFLFIYILEPLRQGDFSDPVILQCLGYTIALIFGLLAIRKKWLLIFVIVGYFIFFYGEQLDRQKTLEAKRGSCLRGFQQDCENINRN